MKFLRKLGRAWMAFAFALGAFVSGVIMTVFYYTLFALFAIPFRLFGKSVLAPQSPTSNWLPRTHTPTSLADFKDE